MGDSLYMCFGNSKWKGSRIPWSFKYNHRCAILEWFVLSNNHQNKTDRQSWIFLISDNNRSGQRTVLCTALSPEVKNRFTRTGQTHTATFTENFLWSAPMGLSKSEVASKNSWWVFFFNKFVHMELRIHQNLFTLMLAQIWMCTVQWMEKLMQWPQTLLILLQRKMCHRCSTTSQT